MKEPITFRVAGVPNPHVWNFDGTVDQYGFRPDPICKVCGQTLKDGNSGDPCPGKTVLNTV